MWHQNLQVAFGFVTAISLNLPNNRSACANLSPHASDVMLGRNLASLQRQDNSAACPFLVT